MAERVMNCNVCGQAWKVPPVAPEGPVHCRYCKTHICACGCGASLTDMKSNARYRGKSCAMALRRAGYGATEAAKRNRTGTLTIAGVRSELEQAKSEWLDIVEEAIADHFRRNPGRPFHADDLLSLRIPEEHRRSIVGSAIASWVNKGRMQECGRRKSIAPSRNGAKSNEYRLTEKGRDYIAGDGADKRLEDAAGLDSAELPVSPAPISVVAGDENSPGREAVLSSTASRSGDSVGASQLEGESGHGRVDRPPPAGTDTPDSIAEDLEQAEGHLFGSELVPISSTSAFNPHNEFA